MEPLSWTHTCVGLVEQVVRSSGKVEKVFEFMHKGRGKLAIRVGDLAKTIHHIRIFWRRTELESESHFSH